MEGKEHLSLERDKRAYLFRGEKVFLISGNQNDQQDMPISNIHKMKRPQPSLMTSLATWHYFTPSDLDNSTLRYHALLLHVSPTQKLRVEYIPMLPLDSYWAQAAD